MTWWLVVSDFLLVATASGTVEPSPEISSGLALLVDLAAFAFVRYASTGFN